METEEKRPSNPLGLAAFWVSIGGLLVLILGFVFFFVSVSSYPPAPWGVQVLGLFVILTFMGWLTAIGLGIAGVCQKGKPKTLSILGICLPASMTFMLLVFTVIGNAGV